MVSGLLVLVSYCVALIPFRSRGLPKRKSRKVTLLHLLVVIFGFFLFNIKVVPSFLARVERFIGGGTWLILCVILSLYLFLTIVVCVNICSKHCGALIAPVKKS